MNSWFMLRLIATMSLSTATVAQTFDVVRSNPNNGYAVGRNVFETVDGFVVFGIQSQPVLLNYADPTVTKFDMDGNFLSEEFFALPADEGWGTGPEPVCSLAWAPGFIGAILSFDTIQPDTLRYIHFDANGDPVTSSDIITGYATGTQKIVAKDNWLYSLGYYITGPSDTNTVCVMRLDTLFNIDWMYLSRRTLGGKAMAVDQFGNVLIGGIGGYPPAINAEGCLMLLDSNGVERWYRESPTAIGQSSSLGEWSGVKALSNGNVLCMGRWSDQFLGSGVNGMCMAAYDTAGTLLWYYQGLDGGFWTNWETAFFDGYQDTDSTFIACGQVAQPTWRRALVYRFTVDGDSLWRREYAHYASTSSDPVERPWDIEPTSDGGMVLTGETWDCAASQCHDLWLLKLDSMGCLVPGCQYVGISDIAFGLEDALHVWPNPSDGRFNVELGLPAELEIRGQLLLQVFDATGRLVLRKDLGRQLEQAIALDLSGEPPGIYHVHITDERRMLTGVSLVLE